MKSILIVCDHSKIDTPLRRSLAHLSKSCRITVVANGHRAFVELEARAFDMIIIDSEIIGIDSIEMAESIEYTDPGIPIILMLKQAYRPLWGPARRAKANPILRPFKPLTFLRLVDTLLHQQLERYRDLSETLKSILDKLCTQTKAPNTFLIDNTGQILVSTSEIEDPLLKSLGNLVATKLLPTGQIGEQYIQEETLLAEDSSEKDHELYLTLVLENLYLSLIYPTTATHLSLTDVRQQLDIAIQSVRQAFSEYSIIDKSSFGKDIILDYISISEDQPHLQFPLKLGSQQGTATVVTTPPPPVIQDDEEEEIAANWQIITESSTVLNRLQGFCQIN